jgi:hypothetical protein
MVDYGDYDRKFVKDLLHARRNSKSVLEQGSDPWPRSFTGSEEYSIIFSKVFEKYAQKNNLDIKYVNSRDFIKDLVDQKRIEGKLINILDVMSYGEVIRDLQASGLAIGLTDERTPDMVDGDKSNNIQMLTGDIFDPKMWETLDQMYPNNGEEFDFIFCRPNGAIERIPDNLQLGAYLLNRMYPHLSRNNGILLTEVGSVVTEKPAFISAIRELNDLPGIQAYYDESSIIASTLMLVKGNEAPSYIPNIKL